MKSKKKRPKFEHIKLREMLTTMDEIEDGSIANIGESTHSKNTSVKFCQVRQKMYLYM